MLFGAHTLGYFNVKVKVQIIEDGNGCSFQEQVIKPLGLRHCRVMMSKSNDQKTNP